MMPLIGAELEAQESKFKEKIQKMNEASLLTLTEFMFGHLGYEDREYWLMKANDILDFQKKSKMHKVI